MIGWLGASCGEVVLVEEKVTGAIFERFVEEYLVPSLEEGDIVIGDNARIHTARAVALVEARGARVLALPRYSPEFNAIEHLWSKLKHYLRKARADTLEMLKKALYEAMERVTVSDAVGWIRHCGYTINPTG